MQRKLLGLLFAAAAYGIYRYTKMTPEQKAELKKRGGDFLEKNMGSVGNIFGQKPAVTEASNKFS
ncbi:MAG TPA: hypothetical protein VNM35_09525 [Chitinophagaceae bacterium]|jgi:hypothetical protein|nr:hypothetical protein [Chitinophagaceae bacterium]